MLKTFKIGGIHPAENKFSKDAKTEVLPIPSVVAIPVAQHIGAPASPIVKKGDQVKVGQLIAKSTGFVSANIHSSVSGTVAKVDTAFDASGFRKPAIIINVEGDEWLDEIDQTDTFIKDINFTKEEIVTKINESGIVGLGGATFPTHVKAAVPPGSKAEVVVINGVECEPYLTADHRLMLEKGKEVLQGVTILMKAVDVKRAVIGIENNKPDAINHLQTLAKEFNGIEIVPLKVQYPQGGEKQLIAAALGKEVPSGALPIAVGAVVNNVGTAYAIYEAVLKGKPLFSRIVTVTGKSVKKPSNFLVRIGTPTMDLIEAAGGLPEDTGKVISGGPMMGKAMATLDVPVIKGTSGVLIMKEEESKRKAMKPCIRCAKCVSVCPMGLEPYLLMTCSEKTLWDKSEENLVMDCIECGSCSFTCPADRPLLDYIRQGKGKVGQIMRSRKA